MNSTPPSHLPSPSPAAITRSSSGRGVSLICVKPLSKRTGPTPPKFPAPHSPTHQSRDDPTKKRYRPGLTMAAPEGTPAWITNPPLFRHPSLAPEVGSLFASVRMPPLSAHLKASPSGPVSWMSCREPFAAGRKSPADEAISPAEPMLER